MGGRLSGSASAQEAPVFVAQAQWDPGVVSKPGTPLERLQIVKGWLDSQGEPWEKVFHLAGDEDSSASVDVETCETSGKGFETLCARWQDPDFDPSQRAFYYARVIETPTCRWSTRKCNGLPPELRPESCQEAFPAKTIQERAWSSAIWFVPDV